jgi:hypothetical protein
MIKIQVSECELHLSSSDVGGKAVQCAVMTFADILLQSLWRSLLKFGRWFSESFVALANVFLPFHEVWVVRWGEKHMTNECSSSENRQTMGTHSLEKCV